MRDIANDDWIGGSRMSRSSPSSAQRAPMKTLGQRCCRSRTVARSAIPCHVPSWRRRAGKALAKSARTGIPSCAARLCNSELCGSCVGLSLRKILPRQRVATCLVWDLDRLLSAHTRCDTSVSNSNLKAKASSEDGRTAPISAQPSRFSGARLHTYFAGTPTRTYVRCTARAIRSSPICSAHAAELVRP